MFSLVYFKIFFFFFFLGGGGGGGGNNLFRKISSSLTTEKMSFSLIEDLLKIRASAFALQNPNQMKEKCYFFI